MSKKIKTNQSQKVTKMKYFANKPMKKLAILVLIFVFSTISFSQNTPQSLDSRLNPNKFGVVYQLPGMTKIKVESGVSYLRTDRKDLDWIFISLLI